jgi:16S rRNA (cytosine967-C5)-methyltransferase
MSFFIQHIQRIIGTYKGHPPLSLFLRSYFKSYPKLGSRDRKALSEAAYIYFRYRRFFDVAVPDEQVLAKGYALCGSENAFLAKMMQEYTNDVSIVQPALKLSIPFNISQGLSEEKWLQSMWQQPRLFIRLRESGEPIEKLLSENGIAFEVMQDGKALPTNCLGIPNGKAIDTLLPEAAYVVQDWSSQSSIYILLQHLKAAPAKVWDVCSGAGGKSILLKDTLPAFELTVSDIRDTILHNLKMRFRQYQLGKVNSIVVNSSDAAALKGSLGAQQFDLVLCDVPCSGSGTWARTPEQFYFYEPSMLRKFKDIQYPIAHNAAAYVKPGGVLAYITCSVFKEENEAVVVQLMQDTTLTLKHQQLIDGIDNKADCMFIAIFEKSGNAIG